MSGSRRDPSSMERLQVLVLPSLYMVSRLLCLTRDKQLASLCRESPPQAVCVAPRAAAHEEEGKVCRLEKKKCSSLCSQAAVAGTPQKCSWSRVAQQSSRTQNQHRSQLWVCVLHLTVQEGDRAVSLTAASKRIKHLAVHLTKEQRLGH